MSDTAIEVPATIVPPVLVTIPNIGQVLVRHWPDGSIEADHRPNIHATWLPVHLLGGTVVVAP